MAAYKEPGVYLRPVETVFATPAAIGMYPCIIGCGARKFSVKSVAITRGEDSASDPLTEYPSTSSIVKIANYDGGPSAYTANTDYELTAQAGDTPAMVTWLSGSGTKQPTAGSTYYVDLIYDVTSTSDVYDLTLVSSLAELHAKYGQNIRDAETNTPVNKLVAAAELVLRNNNEAYPVFIQQVKAQAETPTTAEFEEALAKTEFDERVWRIVPTDISTDIINAIASSIARCSSYEERKERTAFVSYNGTASDFTDVMIKTGALAHDLANKRMCVFYPDTVTMTLVDGNDYTMSAQMIGAALAGREQTFVASRSRTRMALTGIKALNGVKMTRAQMNQLAAKGVLIVTQEDEGANVVVRHQLTTDMTGVQTRELSIICISDYCAKTFRASCESYIGVYNITPETISMIDGTLKIVISTLSGNNIIINGSVTSVVQSTESPDTVLATVRVSVPYPCNYIDITMYLD